MTTPSKSRKDLLLHLLQTVAQDLEQQELELIILVAGRLRTGGVQYGPLNVDDGRDWKQEAKEELLDAVVYLTCDLMRKGK